MMVKNIRTSLTKDEIKDTYERDSPPTESEFQTQQYMEQRHKVESTYPQFLDGIPYMAKEPGVQLQTEHCICICTKCFGKCQI